MSSLSRIFHFLVVGIVFFVGGVSVEFIQYGCFVFRWSSVDDSDLNSDFGAGR